MIMYFYLDDEEPKIIVSKIELEGDLLGTFEVTENIPDDYKTMHMIGTALLRKRGIPNPEGYLLQTISPV